MASPGNQHCADCIGTLSLPIAATQATSAANGNVIATAAMNDKAPAPIIVATAHQPV